MLFTKSRRGKGMDVCAKSLQSCPILCDPMDYSLLGPSVYEVLQARILEWVAMPCSRGSSWPRDWTHISYVSCISRQVLYTNATWEAHVDLDILKMCMKQNLALPWSATTCTTHALLSLGMINLFIIFMTVESLDFEYSSNVHFLLVCTVSSVIKISLE